MKFNCFFLLFLGFAFPVFSQSQFFDAGESGNAVSASYSHFKDSNNFGFEIGKSFSAIVDLNISGSMSRQNETQLSYVLAPALTVHLFKKSRFVIAPSLGYGYAYTSYQASSLKGFIGGVSLYGSVKKEKEIYLIPILSVSYSSLKNNPNNSSRYDPIIETSSLTESFALSVVYKMDDRKSCFVQPSIAFSNNVKTNQSDLIFTITIGLAVISN